MWFNFAGKFITSVEQSQCLGKFDNRCNTSANKVMTTIGFVSYIKASN